MTVKAQSGFSQKPIIIKTTKKVLQGVGMKTGTAIGIQGRPKQFDTILSSSVAEQPVLDGPVSVTKTPSKAIMSKDF